MLIRPEKPADEPAIAALLRAAFERDSEAELAARLRRDRQVVASLVADLNKEIVGHAMFSRLTLRTPSGDVECASLAPIAVLPSRQLSGIGAALVRAGIDACRAAGERAILVVGHPTYFPRFGFSHVLVSHLKNPFAANAAFMGLELVPGALFVPSGEVIYPEAFQLSSEQK